MHNEPSASDSYGSPRALIREPQANPAVAGERAPSANPRPRLSKTRHLLNNEVILGLSRAVYALTSRCHILGRGRVPQDHEGLLLACPHISHYDPVSVSALLGRHVTWMARQEFFETSISRWFVTQAGCFSIDRFGSALPGMRRGLAHLRGGRLVGVFPEGELKWGDDSVLLGGPLKEGAALLARRARVPIVPCVSLGNGQFRRFVRWLPIRSGELWIGFGEPIYPDMSLRPGRASRRELTKRLAVALCALYEEMRQEFDIPESARPLHRP